MQSREYPSLDPWMEEPGSLQFHGVAKSCTWLSDFILTFHFHALEKEMATHSSVLAWRIPGMGKPGGLPSMGSHRVRDDWSDLAAAAAAALYKCFWMKQRAGSKPSTSTLHQAACVNNPSWASHPNHGLVNLTGTVSVFRSFPDHFQLPGGI